MTVKEHLERLTKVIEENPECIDQGMLFVDTCGNEYDVNDITWDADNQITFMTESNDA